MPMKMVNVSYALNSVKLVRTVKNALSMLLESLNSKVKLWIADQVVMTVVMILRCV